MKRSVLLLLVILLLLAGCTQPQEPQTVTIGGSQYAVDITALDLSGQTLDDITVFSQFTALQQLDLSNTGITLEQHDAIQASLPNCKILWTPMFQGKAYDEGSTTLTVSTLTGDDIADLAQFPQLVSLDVTTCRDYPMIQALMAAYPELEVAYQVELGGVTLTPDAAEAVFTDISAGDLATALELLPNLQSVTLEGQLPDIAAVEQLQAAYPNTAFHWQVEICGLTFDNTMTEIDLSGIPMENVEEVESKVALLPLAEKVLMCDCGISNEEMEALNLRHDDVLFVWNVNLGPYTVRSDIDNFIVYTYGFKVNDYIAKNLRYCTEIVALDLGHQDITNCDFVAYMPHLKYLVLADTAISDLTPLTGLTELIYLEIFITNVTDYSPLLTLTSLEDLNISYTWGDPTVLTQMTWLDRLWFNYRCGLMDDEELEAFVSAFPNTYVEYSCESATGGEWRHGQNYYDMRDLLGMHYMEG